MAKELIAFTRPIARPDGFIASFHVIVRADVYMADRLVDIHMQAWKDEAAYLNADVTQDAGMHPVLRLRFDEIGPGLAFPTLTQIGDAIGQLDAWSGSTVKTIGKTKQDVFNDRVAANLKE